MKALVAPLLAALLIAGCSTRPPAAETMAKAREAEAAGNFTGAIELYREVVRDRPDDPLAQDAQFRIATLLQNTTRDHAGAVGAYREYLRRWPDGPQAPTALFLIGFVFHNEMQMLDSAGAAYTAFLDRYPNHEMAESARFELANLGKSPEDLLPPAAQQPAAEVPAPAPGKQGKGGGK